VRVLIAALHDAALGDCEQGAGEHDRGADDLQAGEGLPEEDDGSRDAKTGTVNIMMVAGGGADDAQAAVEEE